MFTNVLLNMGVLGICSLFYILFVTLKALFKYRKKEETISVMFMIAIIGATIAFFVRSTRLNLHILLDANGIWIQICDSR